MWQIGLFLAVWGLASVGAGFMLGRLFRKPPKQPKM